MNLESWLHFGFQSHINLQKVLEADNLPTIETYQVKWYLTHNILSMISFSVVIVKVINCVLLLNEALGKSPIAVPEGS